MPLPKTAGLQLADFTLQEARPMDSEVTLGSIYEKLQMACAQLPPIDPKNLQWVDGPLPLHHDNRTVHFDEDAIKELQKPLRSFLPAGITCKLALQQQPWQDPKLDRKANKMNPFTGTIPMQVCLTFRSQHISLAELDLDESTTLEAAKAVLQNKQVLVEFSNTHIAHYQQQGQMRKSEKKAHPLDEVQGNKLDDWLPRKGYQKIGDEPLTGVLKFIVDFKLIEKGQKNSQDSQKGASLGATGEKDLAKVCTTPTASEGQKNSQDSQKGASLRASSREEDLAKVCTTSTASEGQKNAQDSQRVPPRPAPSSKTWQFGGALLLTGCLAAICFIVYKAVLRPSRAKQRGL